CTSIFRRKYHSSFLYVITQRLQASLHKVVHQLIHLAKVSCLLHADMLSPHIGSSLSWNISSPKKAYIKSVLPLSKSLPSLIRSITCHAPSICTKLPISIY